MEAECEDPEFELQKGIAYFLDYRADGPNDEEIMKKSFECFLISAPYSAIAKHHLGICYYYGLGCTTDLEKGVSYNAESAKEGYCVAILKAILRDRDDGYGAYAKSTAIDQCSLLASEDDPFALFQLGLHAAGSQFDHRITQSAVSYYQRAATLGHVIAQYNLGYRYRDGIGCTKHFGLAFTWIKIAAERGYNLAMTGLGGLYDFGKGVPQDYAEAVKWYRKAAEKGELMAYHNLGMSYLLGEGVDKDVSKAADLFYQGSLAGNVESTHSYAKLLLAGSGCQKDEVKAFEFFSKAALKDHAWSMYRLGLCYEDGIGTAVNWPEAKKMYLRAAEKFLGVADKALNRITRKLDNWTQMKLVWLGYTKNPYTESAPAEERCLLSTLPKDIIGEILKWIMRDRTRKKFSS